MGKTGRCMRKTGRRMGKTGRRMGKTGRRMGKTGRCMRKTGRCMGKTGRRMGKTGRRMGKTGRCMRKTGRRMGKTGRRMGETGRRMRETAPRKRPRKSRRAAIHGWMRSVTHALIGGCFGAFVVAACGGLVAPFEAGIVQNEMDAADEAPILAVDAADTPDTGLPPIPTPPDAGPPPMLACDGGTCAIPKPRCVTMAWSVAYGGGTCVDGGCMFTQKLTYCDPMHTNMCCWTDVCGYCLIPE